MCCFVYVPLLIGLLFREKSRHLHHHLWMKTTLDVSWLKVTKKKWCRHLIQNCRYNYIIHSVCVQENSLLARPNTVKLLIFLEGPHKENNK